MAKDKVNEIEKIINGGTLYGTFTKYTEEEMRRKLRALVRKAFTAGYKMADDSYPMTPKEAFDEFGVRFRV